MLFSSVFADQGHLICALCALFFLVLSTCYPKEIKFKKGLLLLLSGLSIYFGLAYLQTERFFFYHSGVAMETFVWMRLFTAVGAAWLLVSAASWISRDKWPAPVFVFVLISISLVLGEVVNFYDFPADGLVEQLLEFLGLSCVVLAFCLRKRVWERPGELLAGISVFGLLVCQMLSYPYGESFFVVLLAFSYMLMRFELLSGRLKVEKDTLEKAVINIENSPLPIMVVRQSDGKILFANTNAVRTFRVSANELMRYHLADFFVDQKAYDQLQEKLVNGLPVADFEILVKSLGDTMPYWLLGSFNVMQYHNEEVLYAVFQDITIRKKIEAYMRSLAERDPLTSVFNRRFFEKSVNETIQNAQQLQETFGVVMVDVDHFKAINDTYGHKVGDMVLAEIASVCQKTLRDDDVCARYGGDEFALILQKVNAETAMVVAERLCTRIEKAAVLTDDNRIVKFKVSIGVVVSQGREKAEALVDMADKALYVAKSDKKASCKLYDAKKMAQRKRKNLEEKKTYVHPMFSDEDNEEISLLDDFQTNGLPER